MTDPFSGLDLVRAVAEHADGEASELQAKAADLRAEATALEDRATVLLQLHRIAKPHVAERRPSETMRIA
jgi:hypothetical protein